MTLPSRLYYLAAIMVLSVTAPTASLAQDILITDVRIHTMTERATIERGWILVKGDQIAETGSGDPPDVEGVMRIEGGGGTVIPGLFDMHVHYWDLGEGIMYLATGITSVRNMGGNLYHVELDQAAIDGSLAGPRVFTAGPIIDGDEPVRPDTSVRVSNPDQAIGAVRLNRQAGFYAIKLYEKLSPESFRAAVGEAREQDMKVYAHTPLSMSVNDLIALGVDSIEHFDGYTDELATEGFEPESRLYGESERWSNTDRTRYAAAAEAAATSPTTHQVPTFAFNYGKLYSQNLDGFFARPEASLLPAWTEPSWRIGAERWMSGEHPFVQAELDAKIALASAMREAGVRLLLGTDAPNPFVIPGYAFHDEIAAFSAAGYSNMEIIRMATRDAASFLDRADSLGAIAAGMRADLILLRADPVFDLAALREPAGVMVAGHWRARAELDRLLEQRSLAISTEKAQQAQNLGSSSH